MIAQDPRPAYQQGKETDRIYGISLYELILNGVLKQGQQIVSKFWISKN